MDLLSTLLGTGLGLGAAVGATALREYRNEPADTADLLGWGFLVDPGVVLMKDGSFLAGWRYRGPDASASTHEELSHLSHRINDALLPFTDSWMLHIDAVRRPAKAYARELPGGFPDPLTRAIDDERRASYTSGRQHYETEHVLTVTHTPPPELYSRIGTMFIQGESRMGMDWSRVLAGFQDSILALENALSGGLRLERLDSDALLGHLHECLTGLHHPVRAPRHGSYLACVLADQPVAGGFRPRVGDMHVRPVAILGYPHESEPGMLDVLNGLGGAYRWSSRVIPLGREAADQEIKRIEQRWFQKRKSIGAWMREMLSSTQARDRAADERWLDQHALRMGDDTAAARAENASGEVRYCYYTSTLIVMDPDAQRADHIATELVKVLNEAGFAACTESVNALEAFLGSLPGHGYPNIRRALLASTNIADLLPATSIWPGMPVNPSQYFPENSPALMWTATDGSTPFRLNLHDSDVGHTLVVGRTGAGKSILVEALAAQWMRYPDAQLFYFDHGYSAWLLAKACGWTHYDVAAGDGDTLGFQPLARVDEAAERAWAAEWFETIFDLHGLRLTPVQREKVDAALQLLAGMPNQHRTLTDFRVQLQDPELQEIVRYYTLEGNLGYLLDSRSDSLSDAPAQVFELRHLLAMGEKVLVPTLLYLFRRVEQRLEAGRPTLIPIEEVWSALMRSIFANRIHQWLLTLRKQNAAVLLVAHSVSQLHQVPNRHILIESCPTKIYLPNPDAKADESRRLYAELGLNGRETDIIAESTPKRHYYFKSLRGSRRFELELGSLALAFMAPSEGATVDETRRLVESLIDRYDDAWTREWLRHRGLEPWADRLDLQGGDDDENVADAA